jgi:hypothetical protein
MRKFQPGDEIFVRISFQNVVSLKNAFIFFVHEEDENEHIMIGFGTRDEDEPAVKRSMRTVLDFSKTVEKDQKPGIYTLNRINFETFGGQTLDYRGDIEMTRFEVIPEPEFAPIVEDVSIFTESEWRRLSNETRRV